MLRLALSLSLCLASAAFADIAPDNSTQCRGKAAGAACTNDDGAPGVCVEQTVMRPDYSEGPPPKPRPVKMLLCLSPAGARARSASTPPMWTGVLLALLAGAAAWALRRPGVQTT